MPDGRAAAANRIAKTGETPVHKQGNDPLKDIPVDRLATASRESKSKQREVPQEGEEEEEAEIVATSASVFGRKK